MSYKKNKIKDRRVAASGAQIVEAERKNHPVSAFDI